VSVLTWEVVAGVVSWAWATQIWEIRTKSVSAIAKCAAICRHTKNGRISDMGNPLGCTMNSASKALVSAAALRTISKIKVQTGKEGEGSR
jgi:hypothetical protein